MQEGDVLRARIWHGGDVFGAPDDETLGWPPELRGPPGVAQGQEPAIAQQPLAPHQHGGGGQKHSQPSSWQPRPTSRAPCRGA
eukprot:5992737-Alexandrium_andersonii.AAC.1